MRKLKIPGRIIGRKIPSPYRRYFYPVEGRHPNTVHRFMDDTELPITLPDYNGNPQNPIVVMANTIRTFWNSPWGNDPQLTTQYNDTDGDIDRDNRDRAGMPIKPPKLDGDYVRVQAIKYLLNYTVGMLANGSIVPNGRCWCWRIAITNN